MHAQHYGAQENPSHSHSSTSHQRSVCGERGMVYEPCQSRLVSLHRFQCRQAHRAGRADDANMACRNFRMEGQKKLQ